jgi:inositol 1,4,5-triphosphate receptor type 1/inositol 1,4,5-triphosphate receptor type 3
MLYGIFFGILFSNIVSGVMLDAFGALREKNGELIHDKENFCYICNISREALEKKRISFQDHIHGVHFLWNYVFFIYFLNEKSPTDYSGMEYLITTQYNKSEEEMMIDWIPIGEPESFDCKAKLEAIKGEI